MSAGERPTMEDLLERWAPVDWEEAQAAAAAVVSRREDVAAAVALNELTEFERALAALTYARGRSDVLAELSKAIGPAAQTVRADALREIIARERSRDLISFRSGSFRASHPVRRPPLDQRAAQMVAAARREVEVSERARTEATA